MVTLPDFEKSFFEVEPEVKLFEKVESKESIDWAFRWERMTENFKVFDLRAKRSELRDGYDGAVNCSASRSNFSHSTRISGIDPDRQCRLWGNHGESRAGIQSHLEKNRAYFARDFSAVNNKSVFQSEFSTNNGDRHQSKSRSISLWKFVRGAFNENVFRLFDAKKFLINLIPVRAVCQQFSRQGSGSSFIHFQDTDQEPLAIPLVSFLNGFDVLSFHGKGSLT